MLRSVIEKLGRQAIVGGINPLKRAQRDEDPIYGFDTEYDSETREFLSYQLSGPGLEGLWTEDITIEAIAARIRANGNGVSTRTGAWLVTFWSYAELQFLPVLSDSFDWQIYGSGSFDCAFQTEDGFELRIFDISRFFERSSLAKVAQSFGLKKLDWDRTRVTRKDLDNPKFREYAINDARLCRQIMELLRSQFLELGADPLISKTAAGSTATVFRHKFVKEPITTKLPKARIAGLNSCWGGRAEAFQTGHFPQLWEYDLESAYPNAVLSIKRFPTGADLKEGSSGEGFAHVIFKHPKGTDYPAIPVMTNQAQVYPLEGIAWITSFELARARELGAEIEVLEQWYYRGGDTSLHELIEWALEIRRNSTGAKSIAAKLMANSLIGKLAQRRGGTDMEKLRAFCEKEGVSIHDAIKLSSEELKALGLERPNKVGTCFMPEWNALITGFVRAQLHGILQMSNPVYCATDSVWSTKPIKDPPKGLGLKRTGPGAVVRTRFGAIYPPGEEPHIAHHSIWNRKAGLDLIKEFDKISEIHYPIKRAVKLRESIRTRVRLATFLEETRKGNTNWDGKRELLPDGTTRPWKTIEDHLKWRKANG